MLLEDGISYVRDDHGVAAGPGGRACITPVPARAEDAVIAAALDCPGECIFVEPDDEAPADDQGDDDIEPADVVAVRAGASDTRGGT